MYTSGAPQPYQPYPSAPFVAQSVPQPYQPFVYQMPTPGTGMPSDFTTGLCDCFTNCPTCLEGWFCPWCQHGYQYHLLDKHYPGLDSPTCLGLFFGDMFLFGIPSLVFSAYMRGRVRDLFNIRGSVCGDVCTALFCAPCSICQVHRELNARGMAPGGVCVEQPYVMQVVQQPPMGYGSVPPTPIAQSAVKPVV